MGKNTHLVYQKSWELKLTLTIKPTLNRWSGFIDIETTSGAKRIKNDRSQQRLEVDVNFNFSKSSIQKNGYVDDEIWNNLINEFELINPVGGIFNAPFGTGKKLSIEERLRFGETYVYIPPRDFEFNSTLHAIAQLVYTVNEINLYQFSIEEYFSEEQISEIENVLNIKIVKNKPQIKALNLFPLRLLGDGSYITANDTNELIFECHQKDDIEIRIINGLAEKCIKHNANNFIVDVSQAEGLEIYWRHYPMIRILKGSADFFNPSGISVEFDQYELNLLDINLKPSIAEISKIKLKSEYLDLYNLVQFRLLKSSTNINFDGKVNLNDEFELNAQAFGYIYVDRNPILNDVVSENHNHVNRKWLIFSGQLSNNQKFSKNTLVYLDQLKVNLNYQGRFHLMKLKNSNKHS